MSRKHILSPTLDTGRLLGQGTEASRGVRRQPVGMRMQRLWTVTAWRGRPTAAMPRDPSPWGPAPAPAAICPGAQSLQPPVAVCHAAASGRSPSEGSPREPLLLHDLALASYAATISIWANRLCSAQRSAHVHVAITLCCDVPPTRDSMSVICCAVSLLHERCGASSASHEGSSMGVATTEGAVAVAGSVAGRDCWEPQRGRIWG